MSVEELKEVIVNANLTEKHKRVFLAVAEAIADLTPEVPVEPEV